MNIGVNSKTENSWCIIVCPIPKSALICQYSNTQAEYVEPLPTTPTKIHQYVYAAPYNFKFQ